MADDQQDQDKTEDPTPRRRQQAREEGNVAKSQDLSAAVLMMGVLGLLYVLGAFLLGKLVGITDLLLGEEELVQLTAAGLGETLTQVLKLLGAGMLPLLAGIAMVAALAHLMQVGFLYAPKKLQPKPDHLNPVKGFKRIFFEARTYVAFLMNCGKMGLAAVVAWFAVKAEMPAIVGLAGLEFSAALGLGGWIVLRVAAQIAAVLLVLAILDYAWQKFRHEKQLRMTRQQVKDEMKRMEGDPQIKQRRRQIAMQRSMQRIRSEVPTADVVVTNPTHFAVALRYDEARMTSPRVVAKGADLLAMRIRELASVHGVPIVERPPLARALYRTVEVGQEIPEDFYAAVAELLAYVYQLEQQAVV